MWEGWVWRVSVGGVGMKGENVRGVGVKGGGDEGVQVLNVIPFHCCCHGYHR